MPSDVIRPAAFDPGSPLAREAVPATSAPVTAARRPARPPAASLARAREASRSASSPAPPWRRWWHGWNLTPAETTLIELLRGHPALTVSITKTDEAVVVSMAIPGDGVNIGAGPTFEAAFFDLCGRELPPICEPLSSQH